MTTSRRFWVGADPGGINSFGLAFLAEGESSEDAVIECTTVSSVDEAVKQILNKGELLGLGIDAPLWWSSQAGGGRKVDQRLRSTYGIQSGTVQSLNSLRGAALIGGVLLAFRVRQKRPNARITETHPKALLKALYNDNWDEFAKEFSIPQLSCHNEHERDAIIGAICAREGFSEKWDTDLAEDRYPCEQIPLNCGFLSVNYFWPEKLENQ